MALSLTPEQVNLLKNSSAFKGLHTEIRKNLGGVSLEFLLMKILKLNELGQPNIVNWHHREWIDYMKYPRLCILAPRDHSKTFLFSILQPISVMLNQPREWVYIFSATADQSNKKLDIIKTLIENTPEISWLKPSIPIKWGKSEIETSTGGRIVSRGVGSSVRGQHPALIVLDDILPDRQVFSMEFLESWFKTTVTPMAKLGGKIHVIGTSKRHNDILMKFLRQNPEYHWFMYKAIIDEPSKRVLWPERYSFDELVRRRREMGSLQFAQEYQNEPVDESSSLFPMSLLSKNLDDTLSLEYQREYPDDIYCTGVDLALSATTGADYTVMITARVDGYGNKHIVDIYREKGIGLLPQWDKIREIHKRYRPQLIYIESNQYQRVLHEVVSTFSDINARPFQTTAAKHGLDEGVPGLVIDLENQKWRIPRGPTPPEIGRSPVDYESVILTEPLIAELNAIGMKDGKIISFGEHDDTVMALWFVKKAIESLSPSTGSLLGLLAPSTGLKDWTVDGGGYGT